MKREFTTKVSVLREELEVLNIAFRDIRETHRQNLAVFAERQRDKFKAMGGCELCYGRGWRVVWDTLDSLSGCYAEYGPCSNPSCNASVTGPSFDPKVWSKYDSPPGTKHFTECPDYVFMMSHIDSTMETLACRIGDVKREIELCGWLKRGDEVVVVKGRKVPVGVTGKVFWTDTHPQHGMEPSRVGIDTGISDPTKPGKNVVHFVAAANCEKI